MNNAQDDQSGRCWDCGYFLRGVESAQCPECGRHFNRADRTTMNFGRPMGRCGRWALAPLGWISVFLALAACALVWTTVRWPVEGWRFSLMDVGYYARVWEWKGRVPPATAIDACYIAGLLAFWLAIGYWLLRLAMRGIAVARYQPSKLQRGRFWRRSHLVLLLLGLTAVGMGVGWPYRLGQRWAKEWVEATSPKPPGFLAPAPDPMPTWDGTDDDREVSKKAAIR